MKTKLLCEASFKFQELKMWKRSFRARLPWNSKSWRRENGAFMRGVLQIPRGQEVNASLQCSSSTAQSVSTHAKHNSTSSKKRKSHLEPSVPLRVRTNFSPERKVRLPEKIKCFVQILTFKFQIASMIHENEAFVRDILQIPLSWRDENEAFVRSNSKSWRCENEAFVRGFLAIPRVQAVKTKLNSTQLYLLCSTLFNSSLPNSSQLYSSLLCSTLLCSALLNSTRLNSEGTLLLYSTLVYLTLVNSTQVSSAQLYSILLCSTQLCSTQLLRHVPTGLKDLLRHVPTGLKDLVRHVPTGLTRKAHANWT